MVTPNTNYSIYGLRELYENIGLLLMCFTYGQTYVYTVYSSVVLGQFFF